MVLAGLRSMILNIVERKMSREIYFIALVCLFSALTSCDKAGKEKYFTGFIEYAYSYTSDTLNADSLSKERAAKGFFRYDTINYQSRFTGKDIETYYYSGVRNKCIAATGTPVQYNCEDYSVTTDSVLSIKMYDSDEKVLGYSCKILEMQKKNSWVKYYISTDLRIAPATYKLHKSYNWDVYGEKAEGGMILKLEHRFKSFTMSGIAKKLEIISGNFDALEMSEKEFNKICPAEIK
jgi:hypothetical protein